MSRRRRTLLLVLCSCGPEPGSDIDPASEGTSTSTPPSTSTTDPSPVDTSTSTASTGSFTDSSTGETEPGAASNFIDSFDIGGSCLVAPDGTLFLSCECSLWAQNCLDGAKCAPWSNDGSGVWNAVRCAPLDPDPDPVGAPCTVEGDPTSGVDSCELSSMCWNVDSDTLEGECVGFCSGDPDNPTCDDPLATCTVLNHGTLILCLPECDPLADDCDEGYTCRPKEPAGHEPSGFVCLPTDAGGQVVDGCEGLGGCSVDHACIGSNVIEDCETGCCAPYCDRSDPLADEQCSELVDGHTCLPLLDEVMAPPEYTHVGVCGPGPAGTDAPAEEGAHEETAERAPHVDRPTQGGRAAHQSSQR